MANRFIRLFLLISVVSGFLTLSAQAGKIIIPDNELCILHF